MSELAQGGVLLAAVAAAAELSRARGPISGIAERPAGAAHARGLARAGARMPCDTPRLDPELGGDAFREWIQQRDSLAATHGAILSRPKLSAKCAQEWCELWLDAWQAAHTADPVAFGVRRDFEAPLGQSLEPWDWRTMPLLFTATNLTPVGTAFHTLLVYRNAAARAANEVDGVSVWYRQAYGATRTMALRLDSATITGGPDLSAGAFFSDVGENTKNLLGDAAKATGDGLAWSIESVVAPIFGAGVGAVLGVLGSAIAPYLAVGGVAYLAYRGAS